MTTAPDTGPLEVALLRAAKAALGGSSDREIDALNEVVDIMLALFPNIDIDAIEAEAMVWAEARRMV